MSDSERSSNKHVKLFIPGPTEVRPEILDAQTQWMVGHRMPEAVELVGRVEEKLKEVFFTDQRVFILASSGTGLQEAAIRNCVGQRVLNCVNGAFAERWREVTEANGKANAVLEVDWGQPILPQQVAERLSKGAFDALTVVHNETSTGVVSPIAEIADAVRSLPGGEEIMILVDSVSGLSGAQLNFDEWDLDVALTSSQKAFALPAGLAFAAVSDRALERAANVPHRGYYFDFLDLEKYLKRDQTPATPAISLIYALDRQLDDMLEEGMDKRFERHLALRDRTIAWARDRGFSIFAADGYESPTVTCVANDRNIDVSALNRFLREHGMIISNGYGPLKGETFRIAHMGDTQMADLEALLETIDAYLEREE
ncbi:MAG: alanine--glyoxylate aminotransferase family protein [Candidatus Promineifilaceae bacterium]|nr:alanine--glyoxylate aminotransferase family protein [Candidatus Promineifilaceae bacterium]